MHRCCDSLVEEGMLLTVRRGFAIVNGTQEEAYKVYALEASKSDDLDPEENNLGCHVGFLPRILLQDEEDYDKVSRLVKGPFCNQNFTSVRCFALQM